MDASAAVTVCALTSRSPCSVLSLAATLRERGDDLRFPCRQAPRLPRCQRAQFYRTELRSHETLDLEAQRFTQPSYLSRPALGDGDLHLPPSASDSPRHEFPWHHDAVFQLYPLHRRSCRFGAVTTHHCQVGALDLAAWMCQFVRRFTICCQEKHAFGHVVEAPDVRHTGAVFNDVEHGAPLRRIGARRQNTGGLIEDDPPSLRRAGDGFAID